MIIDVTDPANPKETFHIPVPVTGGQAQMVRMCLGSDLQRGPKGQGLFDAQHPGGRRLRVRSLGRDRCQKAGDGVGAAGHSLHA